MQTQPPEEEIVTVTFDDNKGQTVTVSLYKVGDQVAIKPVFDPPIKKEDPLTEFHLILAIDYINMLHDSMNPKEPESKIITLKK